MKKYAILVAAGSLMSLAACNNESSNKTTQAQIDSVANARTATVEADLKAKNDSLISAMAKMKADSQMKAAPMATQTIAPAASKPAANAQVVHHTAPAAVHHAAVPKTEATSPKQKATITNEQKAEQNNKFNER